MQNEAQNHFRWFFDFATKCLLEIKLTNPANKELIEKFESAREALRKYSCFKSS